MLDNHDIDSRAFGLHSPRIGGATDSFLLGIPKEIIDCKGRWSSQNTKYHYLRVPESKLVMESKRALGYIVP